MARAMWNGAVLAETYRARIGRRYSPALLANCLSWPSITTSACATTRNTARPARTESNYRNAQSRNEKCHRMTAALLLFSTSCNGFAGTS